MRDIKHKQKNAESLLANLLRCVLVVFYLSARPLSAAEQESGSSSIREVCGVELGVSGRSLLANVERDFGKQLRYEYDKDMPRYNVGFASIDGDGTPLITCNPASKNLVDEEVIVHELFHLKLRLQGFPAVVFIGKVSNQDARWLRDHFYSPILHRLYYPILRTEGFTPDASRKAEVRRILSENLWGELAPRELIGRYFNIAMEVDDPELMAELDNWYKWRNWIGPLNKARSLVQVVTDANPKTPEESVDVLLRILNLGFDQRFDKERWQKVPLGRIISHFVIIRVGPRTDKKPD